MVVNVKEATLPLCVPLCDTAHDHVDFHRQGSVIGLVGALGVLAESG